MYELITDKRYFTIGVTYYVKYGIDKYTKLVYRARVKGESEDEYAYYKKVMAYRFDKKELYKKV